MKSHLMIGALMLALVGCAATLRVDSDFDASAEFGHFHSFAWIREDPLIQSAASPTRISPLNQRRIRQAIEAELARKGFEMASDRTAADFVVSYTVGARDRIEVNNYPAPFIWNGLWGRRYYAPPTELQAYQEGQLAIDIFDGKTHQPVWHGSATKRITDADRKDARRQIDAAVQAILARFPPVSRGNG